MVSEVAGIFNRWGLVPIARASDPLVGPKGNALVTRGVGQKNERQISGQSVFQSGQYVYWLG